MNVSDKENYALRFSDIVKESEHQFSPIEGYENMPLVTLEEAIKPLIPIVNQIEHMSDMVRSECKNPSDGLPWNESASIMLYSLGWSTAESSFYTQLNSVLRSEKRNLLQPWFLYLKLFITALSKLPSKTLTVHRGIPCDISANYPPGKVLVWWGFTSCTSSIDVLEKDVFMGKTGPRTLFTIECYSGKDISQHSKHSTEKEILLLAARQFKVISKGDLGNDLHMIHLKEIEPLHPFLAPLSSVKTLPPSTSKVGEIISKCQSRKLNLSGECLKDQDMQVVFTQGITDKRCTTLDLSNSEVTRDGIAILARALHGNTCLEELNLSHANISNSGTRLLTSTVNSSILKRLNLEANDISDEGAKYLAEMFQTNTKLIQLSLSLNQITSDGVKTLANALRQSDTCLQIFNLSANTDVDDECIDSVVTMIEHTQSLKKLDLRHCNISEDGIATLRAVGKSKKGFDLWVSNNI